MDFNDEIIKEALSNILIRKREKLKISREELARRALMHPNSLYFIEKGGRKLHGNAVKDRKHAISLGNFMRIAVALQMTPSGLMRLLSAEIEELTPKKTHRK